MIYRLIVRIKWFSLCRVLGIVCAIKWVLNMPMLFWGKGYNGSVLGTLFFYSNVVTWNLTLPNEGSNNQERETSIWVYTLITFNEIFTSIFPHPFSTCVDKLSTLSKTLWSKQMQQKGNSFLLHCIQFVQKVV